MDRKLVLYFSVYGTTEKVAVEIARQAQADLMEIQPCVPYDSDRNHYSALARRTEREYSGNQRPGIRNVLPIAEYDVIFLGYPIWCDTVPMIIRTLLERYDFSGKTLIPFNTHMGSRDSGTWQLIRRQAPKAMVPDGLCIEMADTDSKASVLVSGWLQKLKLLDEEKQSIAI